MDQVVIVAVVGAVSGILGSLITWVAYRSSAKEASVPGIIQSLSNRVADQENRIDRLEVRIRELEEENARAVKELEHWQRSYFRQFKWFKQLLRKHDIDEDIPEFHKKES